MKYIVEFELVADKSPNYNIPNLTVEDVKMFVETSLHQDNRIFRITATNVKVKEMNSSTTVADYVKAMEEIE